MADEEALLVVVGVDEPAGDSVGVLAAHLAFGRIEDIDAPDLDRDLIVGRVVDLNVGLTEDDDERDSPASVCLRSVAMWRSAFMRAFRTRIRPSLSKSEHPAS